MSNFSTFSQCPNCFHNKTGSYVYKCNDCSHMFCDICAKRYKIGSSSQLACPACGAPLSLAFSNSEVRGTIRPDKNKRIADAQKAARRDVEGNLKRADERCGEKLESARLWCKGKSESEQAEIMKKAQEECRRLRKFYEEENEKILISLRAKIGLIESGRD